MEITSYILVYIFAMYFVYSKQIKCSERHWRDPVVLTWILSIFWWITIPSYIIKVLFFEDWI